ncbi:hypothetical protein Nepgr_018895 [Nepenthes gracilis]|uniref:NAC domain-containing protein n=1 Tax=Nepenthes gracilis TaxID=150966 RepID=A0AAD3XUG7_NEPGR|nr:hypothetical protein Nepgr_018895 [Nepenthes gracilis]
MARNSTASLCDEMVWPPDFRFHPTDEELVLYYLKRKMCRQKVKLDIIAEVDVYKWDPDDLPGQSILKTGDRQWFFVSPRDRKYPNGSRSNRATRHGYWKAIGKDRNVTYNSRNVGVKKTLVFYKGRAPKGDRTDWVVHEYTLDEDELKRCQNVQDYYALYKVFKKSGLGPKNGEDYGAPFREEDWVEDENPGVSNSDFQENHLQQVNDVASSDNYEVDNQPQASCDDLEEFLNRIVGDNATEQPNIDCYGYAQAQAVTEEEARGTMVDTSLGEATCSEPWIRHPLPADIDTQSFTPQSQIYEVPRVTSDANLADVQHHIAEVDFLEMNDLLGSEPVYVGDSSCPQSTCEPLPNSRVEVDELVDLDLYHDAEMFLWDLGPIDEATVTHPCWTPQLNELAYPIDYQQQQPVAVDGVCSELWMYDQSSFVSCAELAEQSVSLSTPGVVYPGISITSNTTETDQNQNGKDAEAAEPWFTSASWSFIESIPTTPASAADSALVKRAFERMSSFSRKEKMRTFFIRRIINYQC